jgi:uncharacterized protein (TIGR00255 family)
MDDRAFCQTLCSDALQPALVPATEMEGHAGSGEGDREGSADPGGGAGKQDMREGHALTKHARSFPKTRIRNTSRGMKNPLSLASMTGFGGAAGDAGGVAWAWEIRSVNNKGLELRFRLPSGWDALEPELRTALSARVRRGSVNATLTLRAEDQGPVVPDPEALTRVLRLAVEVAAQIPGALPPRAELLLALPGVLRGSGVNAGPPALTPALRETVLQGFAEAVTVLERARAEEGARLGLMMAGLMAEIAQLRTSAEAAAEDQPRLQRARMMENLRALMAEGGLSLPEERIAQEVALLASRSDVREELDRLASHIAAGQALLAEGVPVGRKLDFLMQEFNREANTLCSKSASVSLTAIGLNLKAAIEQLREQVQNIE